MDYSIMLYVFDKKGADRRCSKKVAVLGIPLLKDKVIFISDTHYFLNLKHIIYEKDNRTLDSFYCLVIY